MTMLHTNPFATEIYSVGRIVYYHTLDTSTTYAIPGIYLVHDEKNVGTRVLFGRTTVIASCRVPFLMYILVRINCPGVDLREMKWLGTGDTYHHQVSPSKRKANETQRNAYLVHRSMYVKVKRRPNPVVEIRDESLNRRYVSDYFLLQSKRFAW